MASVTTAVPPGGTSAWASVGGGTVALEPILWAMHDSPVNNTTDRMILSGLAEKADSDGCNAFPSRKTLARVALCDEKTVQRRLGFLRERGLIALGDQEAARYIPEYSRPKVYDLLIPAAWYGPERLARVNQDRGHKGLPPLTGENRPSLPPAPPKVERSDKGKPRSKGAAKEPNGEGGLSVPPPKRDESDRGGTLSPPGGGTLSPGGGTLSPPTLPSNSPHSRNPRSAFGA